MLYYDSRIRKRIDFDNPDHRFLYNHIQKQRFGITRFNISESDYNYVTDFVERFVKINQRTKVILPSGDERFKRLNVPWLGLYEIGTVEAINFVISKIGQYSIFGTTDYLLIFPPESVSSSGQNNTTFAPSSKFNTHIFSFS